MMVICPRSVSSCSLDRLSRSARSDGASPPRSYSSQRAWRRPLSLQATRACSWCRRSSASSKTSASAARPSRTAGSEPRASPCGIRSVGHLSPRLRERRAPSPSRASDPPPRRSKDRLPHDEAPCGQTVSQAPPDAKVTGPLHRPR